MQDNWAIIAEPKARLLLLLAVIECSVTVYILYHLSKMYNQQ